MWLPLITPSSPAPLHPACTGNEMVSLTRLVRASLCWSFWDNLKVIFYMSSFMRKSELFTWLISWWSQKRQEVHIGNKINDLMAHFCRPSGHVLYINDRSSTYMTSLSYIWLFICRAESCKGLTINYCRNWQFNRGTLQSLKLTAKKKY